MERPSYTPPEVVPVEQEDALFDQSQPILEEESIYTMSVRDRDNLEWKLGKEQRTIEGPNQLHGVYWHKRYWHYGRPQRKQG